MSRALPPYVIDGNLYDALGTVQLVDVVMHNFCVDADQGRIQAWLDRTFAAPSGGAVRYEAIGGKVFLGVAEIGKLYTLVGEDKGYTSEIDVTVWILARRVGEGLGGIRWIPAYLFVDSGPALVSGREVWGFPKQLGRFDMWVKGPDPAGPRTFHIEGWVVSPFGRESKARWAPMFEVRPLNGGTGRKAGLLASLGELAETLVERMTDGFATASAQVSMALGGGGMVMAMLKQFPDAARPNLACYLAVIEAQATVTRLRGCGLTHEDYQVRIVTYDSHPFLSELGISPDWQDVGQGFWMDFDFQQQLGVEVWRAE